MGTLARPLTKKDSANDSDYSYERNGDVQRCNSVRGHVNSLANAGWSCGREQIRRLSSGSKSAL